MPPPTNDPDVPKGSISAVATALCMGAFSLPSERIIKAASQVYHPKRFVRELAEERKKERSGTLCIDRKRHPGLYIIATQLTVPNPQERPVRPAAQYVWDSVCTVHLN